jgi:hypothetical protein
VDAQGLDAVLFVHEGSNHRVRFTASIVGSRMVKFSTSYQVEAACAHAVVARSREVTSPRALPDPRPLGPFAASKPAPFRRIRMWPIPITPPMIAK